jgi:hypothetical protein
VLGGVPAPGPAVDGAAVLLGAVLVADVPGVPVVLGGLVVGGPVVVVAGCPVVLVGPVAEVVGVGCAAGGLPAGRGT